MSQTAPIFFGPFRLEPSEARLWRGEDEIPLRPKALEMLTYLAQRPGRLVTKDDLLKAVWADTYVTNTVLKVNLHHIREALSEEAAQPQFIETIARTGYRFIGGQAPPTVTEEESAQTAQPAKAVFVGRDQELGQLQHWLRKAEQGQRQIVFVSGEPGIGKTALIDHFLQRVQTTRTLSIGRGQCVEHYGAGEGYLPLLEAFGRLGRQPGREQLVQCLHQYAPTWLGQLPALLNAEERTALQPQVQGATQERMLREMAEALEALTAERCLLIVLEDLHWSDSSTLELLSFIAQRREPARLFVIATYRPADVVMHEHPLRKVSQELRAHGHSVDLALELLSQEAVAAYTTNRLSGPRVSDELAQQLYQRTDGNALFMVTLVDYYWQHELFVQTEDGWQLSSEEDQLSVPDGLRPLLEKQIEGLSEEDQQVLEVASVAGTEFTVAAVAAGLKQDVDVLDDVYEGLAGKGQLIEERGLSEWPDGTLSGRYGFRHALYQNVLYDRIAAARRARLHRTIGERIEVGYGKRGREVAAELAVHFERGRDTQRAVQYRQQAGQLAAQRSVYPEAVEHLSKGIAVLMTLPDSPERIQQELFLQTGLSSALGALKGFGTSEMGQALARAYALSQQVEESPQLFPVFSGLSGFSLSRGEIHRAYDLAQQGFRLAQSVDNKTLHLWSHLTMAQALFWQGEFAAADEHLTQGLALYDPQRHRSYTAQGDHDPGVLGLVYRSLALWQRGYPDQALQKNQEAVSLARQLSHPFSLAHVTLLSSLFFTRLRREEHLAQDCTAETITVCHEYGFPLFEGASLVLQGWTEAELGQATTGIDQMLHGLEACQAVGLRLCRPYFLSLLAQGYAKNGHSEEGLQVLSEALGLVAESGEAMWEAELYRLRGEMMLIKNDERRMMNDEQKTKKPKRKTQRSKVEDEAEACFQQALEVTRRQEGKSLELRAAVSLSRLWHQQGKSEEARRLLTDVYDWFTEGFETVDLREAQALLAEFS